MSRSPSTDAPEESQPEDEAEVEVFDEADDGFGGLIPIFDDDEGERESALPTRGVTRSQLAHVAAALDEDGERVVVGILEEAPDAIAALKAASSTGLEPDLSAASLAEELAEILARHESQKLGSEGPAMAGGASGPSAEGSAREAGEGLREEGPARAGGSDSTAAESGKGSAGEGSSDRVERAVSILANLARQMREQAGARPGGESKSGEETSASADDGVLQPREEPDPGSADRRSRHKETAKKIGLLDAAMLGDKLKHAKVRAVYDAGRRAGLIDAARELDALFALDDLRLDDLYDLEERLYELALASMEPIEDDE